MNIIQVQDRLKGVSDDALKGYVTDPTGEVPTYLALGEIGRREDVRKSYEAAQAEQPQKTVAEEKLAAMPQGIGSLTQGMMPPAPQGMPPQGMPPQGMPPQGIAQPPMQSMNPAIAGTGVANLPTPQMPQQNFEAGGIVSPSLFNMDFSAGLPERYPEDNLPGIIDDPLKIFMGNPEMVEAPGDITSQFIAEADKVKQAPITKNAQNALEADLQGEVNLAEARNRKARRDQRSTKEAAPAKSLQDYVDEFQSALGEDPAKAGMAERKARIDKRAERADHDAPFDAMINAGLTMAAGQSSDAITNIARGSLSGVNTYQERLDALDKVEEKQLLLETEMTKIDRAERIAAVEYGMQSEQFKQTQTLKQQLADQKNYLDALGLQIKGSELDEKRRANNAKITNDIVDQEQDKIDDWEEEWFGRTGREYDREDPEFKMARELFMKSLVNQRGGGNSRVDDSLFKIVRD